MNWESGFSEPDPELLEEIAGYFGVSIRELTGSDRR
jgi:transcriptional regulator with XRE-family HTH domain